MAESLKQETAKGVFWSAAERFSVQGIQFLVMLIMARLLTPEDYGIVGMLAVFVSLAQAFVDSGFSQALIHKSNRTDVDNSTVFYFNIVVSVIIYAIFYLCAPLISDFYEMPNLTPYTRVICLSIIINSFAVVQRALYSANIDFKTQTKASVIAVIISGIIGITFAYLDFGPWALVWQQISNLSINTLFLWIYSNWWPSLVFSWQSFRELFSFGSKLLATSLLNAVYSNIHTIVIGKLFSASSLGLYSRAKHFADLPSANFTTIFQRVSFPVMCKVKDDDKRLENLYRRMIKTSCFIIFPLMVGLAAVAKPLVLILLGEKWSECAYLLQIICIGLMWYPMHAINLDTLQVKGRTDLFLRVEIYKKIISFGVLIAAAPFGLIALCYSNIASSLICLYINNYYTKKLIGLSIWQQFADITPVLILNGVMFVATLFSLKLSDNIYVQLCIGIIVGASIYLGGSWLFKLTEYKEITSIIKKK